MSIINEVIEQAERIEEKIMPTAVYNNCKLLSLNNLYINGINGNDKAKYKTLVPTDYYNFDYENTIPYYDQNIYSSTDGHNNIYMINSYRGNYRYIFQNREITESDMKKVLNRIAHVPDIGKTHVYENFYKEHHKFDFQRVHNMIKCDEQEYESYPNKIKFDVSTKIKEAYKILTIPKDINLLFRHLSSYFDEAKKYLKLNEENGFYSYDVNGTLIPIVCKHVVMSIENVDVHVISSECYKDGICKFCKQDITNYNDDTYDVLPPGVISIIYTFMYAFDEQINETSLLFKIEDLLKHGLNQNNITYTDVNVVESYSAIYILFIYNNTKDKFNYNPVKTVQLLKRVTDVCAMNGWDDNKVKEILEDEELFSSVENISSTIASCIINNDGLRDGFMQLENILYDSEDERVSKNQFQKIYKKGIEHINEYNRLFRDMYLSLWNNNTDTYKKECGYNTDDITIKNTYTDNGLHFFGLMSANYCPVNFIHKWTKSACSHCGLNKALDNMADIYIKYNEKINEHYTDIPKTVKIDTVSNRSKEIMKFIDETDAAGFNELFVINIVDTTGTIQNNLKTYNENMMKIISSCIGIDYNKLVWSEEFVKKALCYLLNNNVLSKGDIINKLVYTYGEFSPLLLI